MIERLFTCCIAFIGKCKLEVHLGIVASFKCPHHHVLLALYQRSCVHTSSEILSWLRYNQVWLVVENFEVLKAQLAGKYFRLERTAYRCQSPLPQWIASSRVLPVWHQTAVVVRRHIVQSAQVQTHPPTPTFFFPTILFFLTR